MDTELAHWRQQLSVTPSHLYRQPLLNMTMPTPLQTYREKLTAFYASKRDDPAVEHQRALTNDFILQVHANMSTPVDRTLGPLLILAFFFAM